MTVDLAKGCETTQLFLALRKGKPFARTSPSEPARVPTPFPCLQWAWKSWAVRMKVSTRLCSLPQPPMTMKCWSWCAGKNNNLPSVLKPAINHSLVY